MVKAQHSGHRINVGRIRAVSANQNPHGAHRYSPVLTVRARSVTDKVCSSRLQDLVSFELFVAVQNSAPLISRRRHYGTNRNPAPPLYGRILADHVVARCAAPRQRRDDNESGRS